MHKFFSAAILLLILAGCATRPAANGFDDTRSFDRGFDEVWDSLVQHLADTDFRVKSISRDSGVIYAERARFDDSLATCGTRGLASSSGREVEFNIFVTESRSMTQVKVAADFTESRYLEHSRWQHECSSTGALEASILDVAGT